MKQALWNLVNIFRPSEANQAADERESITPTLETEPPFVIRYPPPEGGIPVVPVGEIIHSQQSLINRIRLAAGLRDDEFDTLYMAVIRRFIGYVHLLPASETHHHRGVGGLFRHSLEVSLFALTRSNGQYMSGTSYPDQKKISEPRWNYAAWLCGLFHDVGKPLSDVIVIADNGNTWNPFLLDLPTWAEQQEITHYFIRWNKKRVHNEHVNFNLYPYSKITESEPMVMEYMSVTEDNVLQQIVLVLTYRCSGKNTLSKVLFDAEEDSVREDRRKHSSSVYGSVGTPVEWHIINALREIYREEVPNKPGSMVWVTEEGLHFLYPATFSLVVEKLRQESISTVPSDHRTQLEILFDTGVISSIPGENETSHKTIFIRIKTPDGYYPPHMVCRILDHRVITQDDELPPAVDAEYAFSMSGFPEKVTDVPPEKEKPSKSNDTVEIQDASASAASLENSQQIQLELPDATDDEKQNAASASSGGAEHFEIIDDTPKNEAKPGKKKKTSSRQKKKTDKNVDWFNKQGIAGSTLSVAKVDYASHNMPELLVLIVDDHVLIKWPDIAEHYSQVDDVILDELSANKWIEVDPSQPDRSITHHNGAAYVMLNKNISERFSSDGQDSVDTKEKEPEKAPSVEADSGIEEATDQTENDHALALAFMEAVKLAIKDNNSVVIEHTKIIGERIAFDSSPLFKWYSELQGDAVRYSALRRLDDEKVENSDLIFLKGL